MTDHVETLRDLRADLVGTLSNILQARRVAWVRVEAIARCHRLVARIRTVDAALCALRVVKPELQQCLMCRRRCMLDYDFTTTEVCQDCSDGAEKVLAELDVEYEAKVNT